MILKIIFNYRSSGTDVHRASSGLVPYRESMEDPRIDAVRRNHTAAERDQVIVVVKRFTQERDAAAAALGDANVRLYRAQQGTSTWFFRTPPDPDEIERELRELASWKERVANAQSALEVAAKRGAVLDEVLQQPLPEPASTEPSVVNAAIAVSVRAAAAHAREVRKVMRETAELVAQAHRAEMVMALTGEVTAVNALAAADRAVSLARCRIDLLRANLLALGAATAEATTALGEVLATLQAAGIGPGQAWKDEVLAATAQVDDIVTKLERT